MSVTPWFDREEILAVLIKRIEGFRAGYRQNCAVLGPESIGKTTLLKQLLQQKLSASLPLTALYLQLKEEESLAEWAIRFIETLLCGVLKTQVIQGIPSRLSQLMEECSSYIPKTVVVSGNLLTLIEEGRNKEVYDQIWDLLPLATQETGFPCLVILDEFHHLQRLPVKDSFRQFGRKIMVQSTTLYIVASSQMGEARSILREGLSLLFGQFEILEIGPLLPAACLKAIRAVWPEGDKNPFLEHLLMELAQGYPGSLDLLLGGLMHKEKAYRTTDQERLILDLLEELLLDPHASLRQRFEAQISSLPAHPNRRFWIQILCTVAQGVHRCRHIADVVHRNHTQVEHALRTLEQLKFVSKYGIFYRIPDRLFQLWLLTAYPVVSGPHLSDPVYLRTHFRDAAWGWITTIRDTIHRPLTEQCLVLLQQWAGEVVEIEGWRSLLPSFKQVELLQGPWEMPLLVCHRVGTEGKGWLVIPWDGPLGEGKALSISQEMTQVPYKNYRKVLLGAYPVEINARVLFHEAHIRLWDREVLNFLLDLYGLPRVPLPPGGVPVSSEPASPIPETTGSFPWAQSEEARETS